MKSLSENISQTFMFGLYFSNISASQVIDYVVHHVRREDKGFVVTPNVDHVVRMGSDPDFKRAYEKAALVLADGVPIVVASRLLGKPLIEKVSGSDLFPKLIESAEKHGMSVFLLGAEDSTAELAQKKIHTAYPRLNRLARYAPPIGFENDPTVNDKIIKMINAFSPDLLCIFLGAPKQEKWIAANLEQLDIRIAFCLGGTLDLYSGKVKRAPSWMQRSGLEWVWRMSNEPIRLGKRYLIDDCVPFLKMLASEWWNTRTARKNGL